MHEHDTTAARLAAAVGKLQSNPFLAASGHAGTLKLLVEYLGEQQRRIGDLEARCASMERWQAGVQQP